jgi:hypothetical protein
VKLTRNIYTAVLTIATSIPTRVERPILSGILFPIRPPVIELERPRTPKIRP